MIHAKDNTSNGDRIATSNEHGNKGNKDNSDTGIENDCHGRNEDTNSKWKR